MRMFPARRQASKVSDRKGESWLLILRSEKQEPSFIADTFTILYRLEALRYLMGQTLPSSGHVVLFIVSLL